MSPIVPTRLLTAVVGPAAEVISRLRSLAPPSSRLCHSNGCFSSTDGGHSTYSCFGCSSPDGARWLHDRRDHHSSSSLNRGFSFHSCGAAASWSKLILKRSVDALVGLPSRLYPSVCSCERARLHHRHSVFATFLSRSASLKYTHRRDGCASFLVVVVSVVGVVVGVVGGCCR